MKQYNEFTKIKSWYKRNQLKQLKEQKENISKNWAAFCDSWRYRELLTKRQQQKPAKEQKNLIIKKLTNEILKTIEKFNNKADDIAKAETVKEIYISVSWWRSRVWGFCPSAEVWAAGQYTQGSASGCGYDKLSAGVGEALNKNYSCLKILYNLFEKQLRKNAQSSPHDVAYGMGYSMPYYEGGVGYSCFRSIFKLAGAKINEWRETKNNDTMIIKF